MRLIIVSGLSGSGKSVALHTLEDRGLYCIDNLPTALLLPLVHHLRASATPGYEQVAIGIDARSDADELRRLPEYLDMLEEMADVTIDIVFLQTDIDTLIRRFSETRRRHPLSQQGMPLLEAIQAELELLGGIAERADLTIETTQLTLHELRALLIERLLHNRDGGLSLLFQSFGYKNGLPADTDFVFDIRCLPNPHWEPRLRTLTGHDDAVIEYLENQPQVEEMIESIRDHLERWLPRFEQENRTYMTVSVGCTGGHHRSVYLVERLAAHFSQHFPRVATRHRELQSSAKSASIGR